MDDFGLNRRGDYFFFLPPGDSLAAGADFSLAADFAGWLFVLPLALTLALAEDFDLAEDFLAGGRADPLDLPADFLTGTAAGLACDVESLSATLPKTVPTTPADDRANRSAYNGTDHCAGRTARDFFVEVKRRVTLRRFG